MAKNQPAKLAALEGHFDSSAVAPMYLVGWVDQKTQQTSGLQIPGGLSFLIHRNFTGPVTGLQAFRPEYRPTQVNAIFQFYHLMIAIGMALIIFLKKETSGRIALNTIGPVWDGNEVWLVIAGGALFAGFPIAYAAIFSAFYLPFMIFLIGLIWRAVAIEFRSKESGRIWRAAQPAKGICRQHDLVFQPILHHGSYHYPRPVHDAWSHLPGNEDREPPLYQTHHPRKKFYCFFYVSDH